MSNTFVHFRPIVRLTFSLPRPSEPLEKRVSNDVSERLSQKVLEP